MSAPQQQLERYAATVPISLLWKDAQNRLSLEIPSDVFAGLREFFTSKGNSGLAFVTGRKSALFATGCEGYVLGFEAIAVPESTNLPQAIQARKCQADNACSLLGFAAGPAAVAFKVNDRQSFREVMMRVEAPALFLAVSQQAEHLSAVLFSWSSEIQRSEPLGPAFPLDLVKLEEQYYAPFTPVFFKEQLADEHKRAQPVTSELSGDVSEGLDSGRLATLAPITVDTPMRLEPTFESPQTRRGEGRPLRKIASRVPVFLGLAIVAVAGYRLFNVSSMRQSVQGAHSTPETPSNPSKTGLAVNLDGAILEIRWDPRSSAAESAQNGRVDIHDGGEKVSVPLDRAQVTAGRLLYSPHSTDTRIQLQIMTPTGPVEDGVRLIRGSGAAVLGRAGDEHRSRAKSPAVEHVLSKLTPESRENLNPRLQPRVQTGLRSFNPPAPQKKVTPETLVLDAPQFTFKASEVAASNLPKLDLRMPAPTPPPLSKVTPPVALTQLGFYVPPVLRTADMLGKTVSVKLHIDEKGRVARVDGPGSSPRLAAAVYETARRWRFNPATTGGKPIPSEMMIHLKFPTHP